MKYLPVKKATLAVAMALWVLGPISANAEIIEFDFNFSTDGSGTLDYDDVSMEADPIILNFWHAQQFDNRLQ